MTATVLPIPYLRTRFREATGIVLSGDAYSESQRDTAMRFLCQMPADVRALCREGAEPARGVASDGSAA